VKLITYQEPLRGVLHADKESIAFAFTFIEQ
jgi:hypothetical protein